ncbi:hypothetical protein FA13DRAFT_1712084 [Coprinellus micaceus]|uniref:Uncharacterized protein n=1 Tax=Coprinellus micaceus TaxID=71717 RepID=A0A4Y7T1K5_COPMI|nr:hypothetical protein FA13DRAFT_1712084 [Coprinellus micaceus]
MAATAEELCTQGGPYVNCSTKPYLNVIISPSPAKGLNSILHTHDRNPRSGWQSIVRGEITNTSKARETQERMQGTIITLGLQNVKAQRPFEMPSHRGERMSEVTVADSGLSPTMAKSTRTKTKEAEGSHSTNGERASSWRLDVLK